MVCFYSSADWVGSKTAQSRSGASWTQEILNQTDLHSLDERTPANEDAPDFLPLAGYDLRGRGFNLAEEADYPCTTVAAGTRRWGRP